MVLSRLTTNAIVPVSDIERIKNLADMTERIWKQKAQQEEDFGDDFPDEFRGHFCIFVLVALPLSTFETFQIFAWPKNVLHYFIQVELCSQRHSFLVKLYCNI